MNLANVDSYTPPHLRGIAMATRSVIEGERKHTTVLFLDVMGSVSLSRHVGADFWHEILEALFRILGRKVHAHGGTINQYTGDGIMALWGAPVADENHVEHACRCALRIRDAVTLENVNFKSRYGIELGLRIGINSGVVVVGRIGDDLRSDYTAQGETAGLAARMESQASIQQIVITEHTHRLLPRGFETRSLGVIEPKGAPPVQAYELRALDDRLSSSFRPRRISRVPFVGRAAEFKSLEHALERAATGAGGVIAVTGEAGIGKTRLCWQLA